MTNVHRFLLRLPRELHTLLVEQAAANGRSVNREIVWRLRRSLEGYSR